MKRPRGRKPSRPFLYGSSFVKMHSVRFTVAVALAVTSTFTLEAEDQARIYVYARRDTAARSWMSISCGNAVVAEIKQGTFFAITLATGQYTFVSENGIPLPIEARAGEELFLRLDWNYAIGRPPI